MAHQGTQPHRFEVRPTSDSHFGWIRTRLALERTLMSWVRTSVALIGFGFTIVLFFEHLQAIAGVAPALRPQAPRYLGLALIAAGDCFGISPVLCITSPSPEWVTAP